MDSNGIGDMSHLLSVEIEGFKFAVEMGKDAVKFLQRLAAIFSNALKWGMIDKSWRYFKESGQTNIVNLREKHPEGFDPYPINEKDYAVFLKFAKKYNMVFLKVPCADKNSVGVWVGKNDAPLMELFDQMCLDRLTKEQVRKAPDIEDIEKVEGEVVYEPPRASNLSDYMYKNGFMDCSQEEFDVILRETYGEQCTTLTMFIEKSMEGADPEAQKKRDAEIAERCRLEDLTKESQAGAVTISFDKKQFAGFDKQSQMVFFQMVKKPPRWLGVPADRLIKMKDNSFTAVLNDQSRVTLNNIVFDGRELNGFRFESLEELNLAQVREVDRTWRNDIASERLVAHEAVARIKDQAQRQVQSTAVVIANTKSGRNR